MVVPEERKEPRMLTPPPAGFVCTNGDCPLSSPCEVCGHGWKALEVAPQTKAEGMRYLMRPGNVYAVCQTGHDLLLKTAPLDEGWVQEPLRVE
jgi:hypothetical protein